MPKIPTFESQARPTAEVGGIKTSFQVPVTNDLFTKAQSALTNYYIKEKEEEAKLKAIDYENKALPKLYEVYDKYKNNPFPTDAADGFQREGKQVIDNFINENLSNENRFVQRAVSTKLGANLTQLNLATIKSSRDAMEKNSERIDKDWDSGLVSKMGTIPDFIKSGQAYNETAEYINNKYMGDPYTKKIKLDEKFKIIDTFSMVQDSKSPEQFLQKLKENPELYKNADLNLKSQLIFQAQEGLNKNISDSNIDNVLDNKLGIYAEGGGVQNVDGKIIKKKDLEEGMNRKALDKNLSPDKVVELSINNNTTVPLYKSVINGGYSNISDTGNKQITRQGLEYYKIFKNQNGFNTLKSEYQIDKQTLESYSRMDFSMNVLKETFDSAFSRELQIKSKPESYKFLNVSDKNVDSEFSKIDMPGLFLGDIQNVQSTKYILRNIANIYYKAGGSESDSLSAASKFIEENYRMDLFNQIIPKDNSQPEYHDAAIKAYIKKLYDEKRINIEKHKLDDIIPDYYNIGDFSNNQGFTLRNKKTNEAISIGATTALGDFDEEIYDSSRLTLKDIRAKVYPLTEDARYKDWVIKYDGLRTAKKRISDLSKPVVESGFGKPKDFDFDLKK
jgi:hypothetical protein